MHGAGAFTLGALLALGASGALARAGVDPNGRRFVVLLCVAVMEGPLAASPLLSAAPAWATWARSSLRPLGLAAGAIAVCGAPQPVALTLYLALLGFGAGALGMAARACGCARASAYVIGALAPFAASAALPLLGAAGGRDLAAMARLQALLGYSPLTVVGGSALELDLLRSPALYRLLEATQAAPYVYPSLGSAIARLGLVVSALIGFVMLFRTFLSNRDLRQHRG